MHLSELKSLHVTELVDMAVAEQIDGANRQRKQDLHFAMLKHPGQKGEPLFAARPPEVHPGGRGDFADRRAVEAALAEQPRADAQQRVAPVALGARRAPAARACARHGAARRGSVAGASTSILSSAAATFLPRLSIRRLRAAPPCSAALSTILIASRLSSG